MYYLIYEPQVVKKDIPSLDFFIQKEIKKAIEKKLIVSPLIYSKPLMHELKEFRSFRVGDYRVIFKINSDSITIFAIGHRKNTYNLAKQRAN